MKKTFLIIGKFIFLMLIHKNVWSIGCPSVALAAPYLQLHTFGDSIGVGTPGDMTVRILNKEYSIYYGYATLAEEGMPTITVANRDDALGGDFRFYKNQVAIDDVIFPVKVSYDGASDWEYEKWDIFRVNMHYDDNVCLYIKRLWLYYIDNGGRHVRVGKLERFVKLIPHTDVDVERPIPSLTELAASAVLKTGLYTTESLEILLTRAVAERGHPLRDIFEGVMATRVI